MLDERVLRIQPTGARHVAASALAWCDLPQRPRDFAAAAGQERGTSLAGTRRARTVSPALASPAAGPPVCRTRRGAQGATRLCGLRRSHPVRPPALSAAPPTPGGAGRPVRKAPELPRSGGLGGGYRGGPGWGRLVGALAADCLGMALLEVLGAGPLLAIGGGLAVTAGVAALTRTTPVPATRRAGGETALDAVAAAAVRSAHPPRAATRSARSRSPQAHVARRATAGGLSAARPARVSRKVA